MLAHQRAPVPPVEKVKDMSTHLAARKPGLGRAILVREGMKGNRKSSVSPIFPLFPRSVADLTPSPR